MLFINTILKRNWLVGLLLTLLFLFASEAGWFASLDRQAYNVGVRFSSSAEAYEDIAVVAIDDKSLQALGAWPWSREVLAETTRLLGRANPKVIGLSMPLDNEQYQAGLVSLSKLRNTLRQENKLSPNVNRALRATESTLRGDDKLAATFETAGSVVLAMPYLDATAPVVELSPALPAHLRPFTLPRVSTNTASIGFGWPTPRMQRAAEIFPPVAKFARQASAVGIVGNSDLFFSEPLMVQYGSEVLPSFALMLATHARGMSMQDIESRGSISPVLGDKNLGSDHNFRIYPRYYRGQNGRSPFRVYSLIDRR